MKYFLKEMIMDKIDTFWITLLSIIILAMLLEVAYLICDLYIKLSTPKLY